MGPQEAAELLGVSRPTVIRMARDGRLTNVAPHNPVLKRQKMRFRRADVERLAGVVTYTPAPQYHIAAEDVPPYTAAPPRPRAEG